VGGLAAWRFCPRCGAGVRPEEDDAECPACGLWLQVYGGPKPAAGALVVDERGRLLLVRRARDPGRGLWDIPGGFLEHAEHPHDALVRELREETGLEVAPGAFVGAFLDSYGANPAAASTLNLIWTARVVGGTLALDATEVAGAGWFSRAELPEPDDCAFPNVSDALAAWRVRPTFE
jgi:ADP-ribose pyrophosphatase YjhB (NUDIX family)